MSTKCRFRNYFSFTAVSFLNRCCSIYENETEYIWAWIRVNIQDLQKQIWLGTANKSIKPAVCAQRSLYLSILTGEEFQEEYKEQGQHRKAFPGVYKFVGQALPQNTAFGFLSVSPRSFFHECTQFFLNIWKLWISLWQECSTKRSLSGHF